MKKELIYFALMLLAIVAGLLLWEASPAIADKIGCTVKATDWFAYFWAFPAIIFSGLFNEAHDARKKAQL